MSIRQQRSTQNRRLLTKSNPARPQDIFWIPDSVVGNVLYLDTLLLKSQIVAGGIPQLLCSSNGSTPTACVVEDYQILLTYDVPPAAPCTFTLLSGDPGLRTPLGGFLIAAEYEVNAFPWPAAVPPATAWAWNEDSDTVIILTVDDLQGPYLIGTNPPNLVGSLAGSPVSGTFADPYITLTYSVPLTSGETMTLADAVPNFIAITGSRLQGQSFNII